MAFNKTLRKMRLMAGLTQIAAATELGVDQTAISQWESGETLPKLERIPAIAKLYGCTIQELLSEDDEKAV